MAAFCVVNALGVIVDRQGRVVRGNLDPAGGRREHYNAELERRAGQVIQPQPHGNTTLTVVITNQKLAPDALRQFGRQVHSSMSRAIQPFHTIYDGDVLYAVTTNEVDNQKLDAMLLGLLASEVVWDAVLSSFHE